MNATSMLITGIGVISAAGNGVDETLLSFERGDRNAGPVTLFPTVLKNPAFEVKDLPSEYYLEGCKKDGDLFERLFVICYNSGKWKKWVKDINRISQDQLIMTCCHYVLSDQQFIEEIKSNFPNADKLIQKRISSKLKLLNEQTKNYCI